VKFKILNRVDEFKNQDDYLRKIYRDNPILSAKGYSENVFVNQAKAYKAVNQTNIRSAVQMIAGTETFTPYKERAQTNLIKAMKEFGVYKELTTSVRDKFGHFTSFDRSKLRWDSSRGGYVYAGQYFVDVSNSPENIRIEKI